MPEVFPDMTQPAGWLPLAFMLMMGFAILAYVILDGFDLGVGLLFRGADAGERDVMIASIGPFWDANETWLVLGVGILLVAFPTAHGIILGHLYLPIAVMLIGLTLRGVAFDFRVKAKVEHRASWNNAFFIGSGLAALSQGYMLGRVITGYQADLTSLLFAAFIAICVASGYALLGATWLIIKTTGPLQLKAITWARHSMLLTSLGIAAVSVATPLISEKIFQKWLSVENLLMVWPIPVTTVVVILIALRSLKRLPVRLEQGNEYGDWVPFACSGALFLLSFHGLAYSLFPYLVLDELTIWDAASAPESLMIILFGAVVVVPIIMAYSLFAYRVFWGKARPLDYG